MKKKILFETCEGIEKQVHIFASKDFSDDAVRASNSEWKHLEKDGLKNCSEEVQDLVNKIFETLAVDNVLIIDDKLIVDLKKCYILDDIKSELEAIICDFFDWEIKEVEISEEKIKNPITEAIEKLLFED